MYPGSLSLLMACLYIYLISLSKKGLLRSLLRKQLFCNHLIFNIKVIIVEPIVGIISVWNPSSQLT